LIGHSRHLIVVAIRKVSYRIDAIRIRHPSNLTLVPKTTFAPFDYPNPEAPVVSQPWNEEMERFNEIIRAPGAKGAIEDTAPTQRVDISRTETDKITSISPEPVAVENVTGYIAQPKDRLLDRWLDWIVKTSGSEFVFFSLMGALLTWAFMGIPFGQSTDWQVVISDVQAIIGYIFDSLLMRQQSNGYDKLMRVSACLRSRNISNKRMLRAVTRSGTYQKITSMEFEELQQTEFATELPAENWLGQVSTFVSGLLGHISTVCLFWVGILIWIGFGHYCGWSDKWELYINSATSALMMFVFTFLANIRERHSAHTERCLNSLYEVDSALEHKLRTITGDTIPNQTVTIPAPKFSKVQRAIYYYADIVGNLVGIAILIVVMILWVAIGPAMSFDSNWWLLIGTYAGLVGMNDGFVLRNVHSHLKSYEDAEFEKVGFDDMDLFAAIDAPAPKEEYVVDNSFSCRLSIKMGVICSHEITVVLGVILIIGLIIGSSAMRWSITGQLLCNIPPSIIESFFMIILITGHNISSARRRVDLHNIYLRRLKLISYVDQLTC
jgi:low-affinity ferrous iron transport protein